MATAGIGYVCPYCSVVYGELEATLMYGEIVECVKCNKEICHQCLMACDGWTDRDCDQVWCYDCARKCKICEKMAVECRSCRRQHKEEFKWIKKRVCEPCWDKDRRECKNGKNIKG